MLTKDYIQQIDSPVKLKPHFIGSVVPTDLKKFRTAFYERKKLASTLIWLSVAGLVALQLMSLNSHLMIAATLVTAFLCWNKYRSLCKCPNCQISLVVGSTRGRATTAGFSTKICPRCVTVLISAELNKRPTDAQARKLETKKWTHTTYLQIKKQSRRD